MNTITTREGSAADLLYAPEAAAILGITVTTFEVGRATGYAPTPCGKDGVKLVFRRGDLWSWLDQHEAGRVKVACEIPGCNRPGTIGAGRLCPEHGRRAAVRGTRDGLLPIPPRPLTMSETARFASHTEPDPTGCVVWVGSDAGNSGYGKAHLAGHPQQAHRVGFFLAHGRMPGAGMELDHECLNRLCVRVGAGHVVEVTRTENTARKLERLRARKAAQQAADLLPFPSPLPAESAPVNTPLRCAA